VIGEDSQGSIVQQTIEPCCVWGTGCYGIKSSEKPGFAVLKIMPGLCWQIQTTET
jgi:hypothetical protein